LAYKLFYDWDVSLVILVFEKKTKSFTMNKSTYFFGSLYSVSY
jgi:hypothetical protein